MRFLSVALPAVAALAIALAAAAADGQNAPNRMPAQLPESQQVRDFSDATLAKIVPGSTAKPEVESMLGRPWRETVLDEEDIPYPGDPSVEVWEYRGRDSQGAYRVHIEFDRNNVTTLIAKIPNNAFRSMARVANPMPDPGKQ